MDRYRDGPCATGVLPGDERWGLCEGHLTQDRQYWQEVCDPHLAKVGEQAE
jgi:hypothetical protein